MTDTEIIITKEALAQHIEETVQYQLNSWLGTDGSKPCIYAKPTLANGIYMGIVDGLRLDKIPLQKNTDIVAKIVLDYVKKTYPELAPDYSGINDDDDPEDVVEKVCEAILKSAGATAYSVVLEIVDDIVQSDGWKITPLED